MTVEKFLEEHKYKNVKKLGYVSNKTLSKVLKRYKHIDVHWYWYDSENQPDFNNWVDVEGIGYGWIWCNYTKERNDNKLRKHLIDYVLEWHKKQEVWTFDDDIKGYIFSLDKVVIVIMLSNSELDPW